jgi:hypothetical protein
MLNETYMEFQVRIGKIDKNSLPTLQDLISQAEAQCSLRTATKSRGNFSPVTSSLITAKAQGFESRRISTTQMKKFTV